jgi:hypothetical protein
MTIGQDTMIKPGDVMIDEITLQSHTGFKMSLKGIFESITIYEDMFSNVMSGSISLINSYNIVKNFPIIGAETLTISYRTPMIGSEPVKLVFRTYKISLLSETLQESNQLVRVEFISHEAIKSMQKKISKSYKNMPVSRMVRNIYDEYLAKDNGEMNGILNSTVEGKSGYNLDNGYTKNSVGSVAETIGTVFNSSEDETADGKRHIKTIIETYDFRSYVIPYMTPFQAINWLCHRSRAKVNTSMCDYVFFENQEGHHFVPISWLKTQPTSYTYTNYPEGFRNQDSERMLESELRNVHSMTVHSISDKIKQQTLGLFASALMTHDLTTKMWNTVQYRYDYSFTNDAAHLEKNPLVPLAKLDYTDAVESSICFYPNSSFTSSGMARINDPDEIYLLRQSLLNQINSVNLIVECHGDSNVMVGQVIDFKTISKESTTMQDRFDDDYLQGRYLITALKHTITDREHSMVMTLSRDSFAEPVAEVKGKELKV